MIYFIHIYLHIQTHVKKKMKTKILGFAKIKICSDQKTDKANKFLAEKKLFNQEMLIPIENIVDKRPFSKVILLFSLYYESFYF